jgi:Lar family restriction alleviation protein
MIINQQSRRMGELNTYILRRCPFCGRLPVIEVENLNPDGMEELQYTIVCTYCYASSGGDPTKIEAVKAWNERVTP